jgi:hypothetical protein
MSTPNSATDDPFAGLGDAERRVLRRFVRNGRIVQIPAKLSVRRVLLDWLVLDFEPGRAYSEQMVNLIIGQRHPDTAALRRYLVDEGLMARARNSYRRLP